MEVDQGETEDDGDLDEEERKQKVKESDESCLII